MKIVREPLKNVSDTYRSAPKRADSHQETLPAAQRSATGDTLIVSDTAKQMASFKAKIQSVPEIRTDLVERLKARMESGAYDVAPAKVAERMLRSGVFDE